LSDRKDDIIIAQYKPVGKTDKTVLEAGALCKEVITGIRDARNRNQLKPKDSIRLHILTDNRDAYAKIESILMKQVNAEAITYTNSAVGNTITVVVQKDKFFIETSAAIDTGSQKDQLQKDLEYLKGFLASVEKKLGNERFVQNAKPEVVEAEQKKKADAEEKIRIIEESLGSI
jgi:valyl-tRNA synthetase